MKTPTRTRTRTPRPRRPKARPAPTPPHVDEVRALAGVFAMDGRDVSTAFDKYKGYSPALRQFMSDRLAAANALLLLDVIETNRKLIREAEATSEHASRTSSALIRQVAQFDKATKVVTEQLSALGEDQVEGFERLMSAWNGDHDDEPLAPLPAPSELGDYAADPDDTREPTSAAGLESESPVAANVEFIPASDLEVQ